MGLASRVLSPAFSAVFAGVSIAASVLSLLHDREWYKYKYTVIYDVETYDTFDNVQDYDSLYKLYKIVFYTLMCATVAEGLALVLTLVLIGLVIADTSKKTRQVFKFIGVACMFLATGLFLFGSLYFIRHPHYYSETSYCIVEQYACKSFLGSSDSASWGPAMGWIQALIATALVIPAWILLVVTPTRSGNYLRL